MDDQNVSMSMAPTPAMIIAMREKTFNWRLAFCELIDNSFDAKADRIRIEMRNRKMRFVDNGVGAENPAILLVQGRRKQHSGQTLGRYGVGASDAFMWLYGTTTITSCDGKFTRHTQVRWSDIAEMQDWPQLTVSTGDKNRGVESGRLFEKNGTCIEIDGHIRNNPPYENLVKDLGFTYWPGLEKQRRKITFYQGKKAIEVTPFKPPRFKQNEFRTVTFEVNGKKVTATGGNVMENAENRHPGFNVSYDYRVIYDSDERAAGDKSVDRFFCHVELDSRWMLGRNKDRIGGSANDEAELWSRLGDEFGDLIDKSNDRELRLALANIEEWLEGAMEYRSRVAVKRDSGEGKGSHPKTGTGSEQGTAAKVKPGSRKLKTKRGSISVDIIDGSPNEVGRVSIQGSRIAVRLYRQFPPVAAALKSSDMNDLKHFALALVAHAQSLHAPCLPAMTSPETDEFITNFSKGLLTNFDPRPVR